MGNAFSGMLRSLFCELKEMSYDFINDFKSETAPNILRYKVIGHIEEIEIHRMTDDDDLLRDAPNNTIH